MSVFQIVVMPVAILLLVCVTTIQTAKLTEVCSTTSDCPANAHMYCKKVADSCDKGRCNCESGYQPNSTNCVPVAYMEQTCNFRTNTENGECVNEKVACTKGYSRVSNSLCRNDLVRILGESVNDTQKCYHYQESIQGAVFGTKESGKICGCDNDRVWVGTYCRTRGIGDSCSHSDDCQGTPSCLQGVCRCKSGQTQYGAVCYDSTEFGDKNLGDTCVLGEGDCIISLRCFVCTEDEAVGDSAAKYTCIERTSDSSVRLADVFTLFVASLVALSRSIF